jgi:hypothetical protein
VRPYFYSVPARFVRRRIDVYLAVEHVETHGGDRFVACHERPVGTGTERQCLDHYFEDLDEKPGAMAAGATALGAARASGSVSSD